MSPLRVLIIGQQNNFGRVLTANIQQWGHEAVALPSTMMDDVDEVGGRSGDIVLCDLDEPFYQGLAASFPGGGMTADMQHYLAISEVAQHWDEWCERWLRNRFSIVMSSRSISRSMLEAMGAVAFLLKPFEIGRLQRYLRVLQRLVLPPVVHEQRIRESRALQMAGEVPGSQSCLRVLVVDDDVVMVQAIAQCLSLESEFEILVAYDGLAALELCLDWQPHCVVTDLIMPWMNGYQVMRCLALSALRIRPAFIITSALTRLEMPVNRPYMRDLTVQFLNKPFHMRHLIATIKQVCRQ